MSQTITEMTLTQVHIQRCTETDNSEGLGSLVLPPLPLEVQKLIAEKYQWVIKLQKNIAVHFADVPIHLFESVNTTGIPASCFVPMEEVYELEKDLRTLFGNTSNAKPFVIQLFGIGMRESWLAVNNIFLERLIPGIDPSFGFYFNYDHSNLSSLVKHCLKYQPHNTYLQLKSVNFEMPYFDMHAMGLATIKIPCVEYLHNAMAWWIFNGEEKLLVAANNFFQEKVGYTDPTWDRRTVNSFKEERTLGLSDDFYRILFNVDGMHHVHLEMGTWHSMSHNEHEVPQAVQTVLCNSAEGIRIHRKLDAKADYSCGTTHCRAGYNVVLSRSFELEAIFGPATAGNLIYLVSLWPAFDKITVDRNEAAFPVTDFNTNNVEALYSIFNCAYLERMGHAPDACDLQGRIKEANDYQAFLTKFVPGGSPSRFIQEAIAKYAPPVPPAPSVEA